MPTKKSSIRNPQVNEVDPTFETWRIIRSCATVGYRRGVRNSFCQNYSQTRSSTPHRRWTPPDDALWDLFGSPVKLHQVKSDGYESVVTFDWHVGSFEKVGATKCRPQLVDETLGIPNLPRRGFYLSISRIPSGRTCIHHLPAL